MSKCLATHIGKTYKLTKSPYIEQVVRIFYCSTIRRISVYLRYDLTTNTVKKLIIYYFHLYHQEYILKKDTLKLAIVAKRYALSFLGPLFMWVEYSDEFTLKETKKIMKLMVLNSPYDISTHGF